MPRTHPKRHLARHRLLVGAAVALSLAAAAVASAKAQPPSREGTSAGAPQVVDVGIWPLAIYDLDIAANTFYMAAYVWFTWSEGPDPDPSASAEFANNVESWGLTRVKTYPEPLRLADGRRYQCLRIEGRFFAPLDLSRFPLERYTLGLSIEDGTYPADRLVYRFDRQNSGLDPRVELPGWNLRGWDGTEAIRHYATTLGDPGIGAGGADFSTVLFRLAVDRPGSFFAWKMLLPAVIVLLATWSALLLHPTELSARVAMTGTALLTAVFLQQGYSSNLPSNGSLVLMDRIYALVYLLVIAALVQVVIQGAMRGRHERDAFQRALRIDRASVALQAIAFALGLWGILHRFGR